MKKTIWLLIPVLILVLLSGCFQNTEEEVENDLDYMSKEEFFEYITTHEVDVTVDDFSDVDIDDFIRVEGLVSGMEFHETYSFRIALGFYLYNLDNRKFEPFMAREIKSIPSTDEEFVYFKEIFFKEIDKPYESYSEDQFGLSNYTIIAGETKFYIKIGQTMYFDKCMLVKNNQGFYCVYYEGDPGVARTIIYSKSSKYFILGGSSNVEQENEFIQIFCELDDSAWSAEQILP